MACQIARLSPAVDALAPDGAEIRLLVQVPRGSMVHCRLAPGEVSRAVRHRTVEEVWYCVAGRGQFWCSADGADEIVDIAPGVALSIPLGASFQYRAIGPEPLEVVITTMPPWPGADEAVAVSGHWRATR